MLGLPKQSRSEVGTGRVLRRTLLVATLLVALSAGAAWRERDRARHIAVPVLLRISGPPHPPPAAEAGTLPPFSAEEVARVGRRVTALAPGADGEVWVGTFDDGVVLIDGRGAAHAVPALAGRERFVNALVAHEGAVWAATQGGLVVLEGARPVARMLGGEAVAALARSGGALYAGTARGLYRASRAGSAEPVPIAGPRGEPLRITALAAGDVGRLWIGTSSGVYSLPLAAVAATAGARTAAWHPLVFGDPPAETDVVTALARLGDGVVAGTDDGGIARVGEGGAVSALRLSDARANDVNPGAAAATGGDALFGTQGGGLLVVRARGATLEAARPAGLERAAISALWAGPEEMLIGTAEGMVARLACAWGRPSS